jgi:lysophospholipase L1-like esterase
MKALINIILLLIWPLLASAGISDMNVVLLGDSNTWIGGDDCSKPKGWNYWWIRAAAPTSCRSYARSGATWTNTAATKRNLTENIAVIGNDNVIYNQVERLTEAVESGKQQIPDLIVIAAGTNDAWFYKKRPGLLGCSPEKVDTATLLSEPPAKITSLAGSIFYSCLLLQKRYPDALIVITTPHQSTAVAADRLVRVSDIIARCGAILSIPVIRQDTGSGIVAEDERRRKVNTSDGTHTSEAGARMVAQFLLNEINTIVQNR